MARVFENSEINIVKRRINDKTFESRRPAHYNKTKNQKGRTHYSKFGSAIKFASFLIKIKALARCWLSAKMDGTRAYNRIILYNAPHMAAGLPTENSIITPPGFKPPFKKVTYTRKEIIVSFNDSFRINKSTDRLVLILVLSNSNNRNSNSFKFLEVSSGKITSREIRIKPVYQMLLKTYDSYILYAAVIKDDPEKLKWSSTFAISGEFYPEK